MIKNAAYYLAKWLAFCENCQLHDWLEVEIRIDRVYGPKGLS